MNQHLPTDPIVHVADTGDPVLDTTDVSNVRTGEDGSLVAEYGLLAVVAATIAGVLIAWARGEVLTGFFTDLLTSARNLVIP